MDNIPTAQPQQVQPEVKQKSKAGRPSKFKQIKIPQLRKILALGATNEQIAEFFNISLLSLKRYRKDNSEFDTALKRWKEQADERVADSLFHRAIGYEHPSEEIHIIKNKVVRVQTRKIYPPDTTAQIFWLKNRQPDRWRDHPLLQEGDELKDTKLRFSTVPDNGEIQERYGRFIN